MATKTRLEPDPATNAVSADVKKCGWQQPDDVPPRPTAAADTARRTLQSQPTTNDHASAGSVKKPGSHSPPSTYEALASKPEPVPFAWGYFGASGKW
jgi:hypothetical protein